MKTAFNPDRGMLLEELVERYIQGMTSWTEIDFAVARQSLRKSLGMSLEPIDFPLSTEVVQ